MAKKKSKSQTVEKYEDAFGPGVADIADAEASEEQDLEVSEEKSFSDKSDIEKHPKFDKFKK